MFDIDKIHNYRDNHSLIGSGSDNLSDLSSLNSYHFGLNELRSSSAFASNMSIYRQLTRSDPELYSTSLLSCGDTDGDSRDKQLFYLKTIYLTFKSLNVLDKIHGFKRKTADFLASAKPEAVLSDKEDFGDQTTCKPDQKKIDGKEDIAKQRSDQKANEQREQDGRNDQVDPIETNKDLASSSQITLDKVISCVELEGKLPKDDKKMKFDENGLNKFLNSSQFNTKTILNKIESLSNFDPIFQSPKNQQMKPIRASSELFRPFFRLNLLDNFITRTISNKLPTFSLQRTLPSEKCNCKKNADQNDQMEVIDLNDENNYKYYKESIFDSFDLDVKDEEAIRLEFDRKFETFLQEDLRKLNSRSFNRPFRLESSLDSKQSETSQQNGQLNNKLDRHLDSQPDNSKGYCDTSKGNDKSEPFDSVKRLTSFQSRIPVLQRDKTKFSRAMLGKLKIKYDPLNVRKRSMLDALDEDYERSSTPKKKSACPLGRRGAHQVGSIDKLNHRESKDKTAPKTITYAESIRSLKPLRSSRQSIQPKSTEPLKATGEDKKKDVRHRPDSSTATTQFNVSDEQNNRSPKSLREFYLSNRGSSKLSRYRPSRIPKFMCEQPTDEQLLMNRKDKLSEARRTPDKSKFYHLIKETTGLLRGLGAKSDQHAQRSGEDKKSDRTSDRTSDGRVADEQASGQQDYQRLKRCVPRTKSESFINEQLSSHRISENFRNRLLQLELKTNGNCLFQLYDYFDDFKDRSRKDRK